ncbi:hypothetical protein [Streptococcus plurextorum]|uniref:hypothetical protein n=1 Tax=Streptococcus plurextorum TaxID=456876 RepID=UPI00040BD46B|nr:hypothetical protein [Streptococcus plurextorum]
MELAVVVPLTKLIIHVDNGGGTNLKGTGLAAEYNIFTRSYTWRQLTKKQVEADQKRVGSILNLIPFTSPFLILGGMSLLNRSSNVEATPFERFGFWGYIIPMLLSLSLFILFEHIMILMRESIPIVKEPSLQEQIDYFTSINNIAFRYNDVLKSIRTPYLANILVCSFVIFVTLPLIHYFYISESNFAEFVLKLLIYSMILSLIPNFFWNIFVKAMVIRKTIQKLEERTENE